MKSRTLEQNLDGITLLHLEVRGGLVVGNPLTVEQQSVIRTARASRPDCNGVRLDSPDSIDVGTNSISIGGLAISS